MIYAVKVAGTLDDYCPYRGSSEMIAAKVAEAYIARGKVVRVDEEKEDK